MKNVLKTLRENKANIGRDFSSLEQKRQETLQAINQAQTNLNQLVAQLTQLQGQWAAVDKLEKDFADEPKDK